MKKIKFLRYRLNILFAVATFIVALISSCEKEQALLLEITNPFDVFIRISSTDIDECSAFISDENVNTGCVIPSGETKTFTSDGMRRVISILAHEYGTDDEYPKTLGEINFSVEPNNGESYKWEVGFDKPVYNSKGINIMDTGGSGGGDSNGGGSGGGNGGGSGNGQIIFWRSRDRAAFYTGCAQNPGAEVRLFYREELGKKRTTQLYNAGQVNCNTTAGVAHFSLPPGEYYYGVSYDCTLGGGPFGPIAISAGECKVIMLEK